MTPTEQLLSAGNDAEVVAALYRGAHRKFQGREPSDPAALRPEMLFDLLSKCPEAEVDAASAEVDGLLGPLLDSVVAKDYDRFGKPNTWQPSIVFGTARWRYWERVSPPDAGPGGYLMAVGEIYGSSGLGIGLMEVQRNWRTAYEQNPGLRHPLAPLVEVCQRQMLERAPERRRDKRLLPTVRIAAERERGHLIMGGLVGDRSRKLDPTLPLWPELEPARHRVPLLDVVDASGAPLRSKGKGAPVEARLLVQMLLSVKPSDRNLPIVRIALTVGEMYDALYPLGARGRRRIAQHWPAIKEALRHARDWTIPDRDGGVWFPLALRRLPTGDGVIPPVDGLVVLDVAPPPGAITGPSVDLPAVIDMGVTNGPRWRAYLAARSLVWQLGITRVPVPGRRGRYGWSRDLSNYPVLTIDDLRRLGFGARDKGSRARAAIVEPWLSLPDVVMLPDQTDAQTGSLGWRILPAEAKVNRDLRRTQP